MDADVASGICVWGGERNEETWGCENDETRSFYGYMRVIASWVVRQETSGARRKRWHDYAHCVAALGLDNSCCHGHGMAVDNWTIRQSLVDREQ